MVTEVGEGIATFVTMPETRQIAQPRNLMLQIYEKGRTKSQNKLTAK